MSRPDPLFAAMNQNDRPFAEGLPFWRQTWFTLGLALLLWVVIFLLKPLNFWIMMPLGVGLLATLSFLIQGNPFHGERLEARDWLWGVGSALVLYGLFFAGDRLSAAILPFAPEQVTDIYGLRELASPALIGLLLALVIGPGEELYWRALVQRSFMARLGTGGGWLLSNLIYAGIHVVSGNFMLVMAALVAGLFWGYLYSRQGRVWTTLISHTVWDVLVLVLFPIR